MAKTGRNEPCPCGSGKKYKKCCIDKAFPAQLYTQEERVSVLDKLEAFGGRMIWDFERIEAESIFWGKYEEYMDELEDEYVQITSHEAFDFWFGFDARMNDGSFLAEHFLESGAPLSDGERRFLEQALKSCMRFYEAIDITPGQSVTVRDMMSGETVKIKERSGSRHMRRWDTFAARILPSGASGKPEIDGGIFMIPRAFRDNVLGMIECAREEFKQYQPEFSELEFYKNMPPIFHKMWLQPFLRESTRYGEEIGELEFVNCRVHFSVTDMESLSAILDSQTDFFRAEAALEWAWRPEIKDGSRQEYGTFILENNILLLKTDLKQYAEKGRAKIERIAKGVAEYKYTQIEAHNHLMEIMEPGEPASETAHAPDSEEAIESKLKKEKERYLQWLDMPLPVLDDRTPRQAAKSKTVKPLLIELLKDLQNHYEASLRDGQPGLDPSWLWRELELNDEPHAPGVLKHPPITGFESMERHVKGINGAARKIAAQFRRRPDFNDSMSIDRDWLQSNAVFTSFIDKESFRALEWWGLPEHAAAHAGQMATHLEYMSNYELHYRKTFWIDESLAWMLGQTTLDITGDILKPPFPAFALIFTDRYTLEIAEHLMSQIDDCEIRGRLLHIMSVYVIQIQDAGMDGLRLVFMFDALAEEWPYFIQRDLKIGPDDNLEQIVKSHFPEIDVDTLDPVFSSGLLRRLAHLVVNAILYTTSGDIDSETRPSPKPKKRTDSDRSAGDEPDDIFLSSQEVVFLPGKINISRIKAMRDMERTSDGKKLMVRFMVRGHWRRANPNWKDQRPRWIEPYWKGPDMATIIERQYKLNP